MVVAAVSRPSPLTSIRKLFAPGVRAEAEPLSSGVDNERFSAGHQIAAPLAVFDPKQTLYVSAGLLIVKVVAARPMNPRNIPRANSA